MNTPQRWTARRDALTVGLLSICAAVLCVTFDVSEILARFTRPLERLQLDEAPIVLLVMAVSLIWFSARRNFEARRELQLRRTAETSLEHALAENQRLALNYVDLREREHKALARDLHDELGQYVNAMKLDAVTLREAAAEQQPAIQAAAQAMITNLDRVYGVLRGLIGQLRPVGFDDLGMVAALEHFINEWRARLPAVSIELSTGDDLDPLDEIRGLVVYRLVQEAMTNMARHSAATQVRVGIHRASAGRIDVVIADDGRGADLSVPRNGLGLIGMRERVAALGGELSLATAPGQGFTIRASLPMRPA